MKLQLNSAYGLVPLRQGEHTRTLNIVYFSRGRRHFLNVQWTWCDFIVPVFLLPALPLYALLHSCTRVRSVLNFFVFPYPAWHQQTNIYYALNASLTPPKRTAAKSTYFKTIPSKFNVHIDVLKCLYVQIIEDL